MLPRVRSMKQPLRTRNRARGGGRHGGTSGGRAQTARTVHRKPHFECGMCEAWALASLTQRSVSTARRTKTTRSKDGRDDVQQCVERFIGARERGGA